MNTFIKLAVIAFLSVGLIACETKQKTGTLLGAAGGAAIGTQIGSGRGTVAAVIGGAIIGGFIGNYIGKSMDESDRAKMGRSLEHNRANQTSSWRNPDSGNRYAVTPTRTFTNSSGEPCRDYTSTANVGGKQERISGTACRQSDGTWRVN